MSAPPTDRAIPAIATDQREVPQRGPAPRKGGAGGRPSRDDALRLGERILDVATELFLTEGYGSTSIEEVAARAGISKRTFYHRFDDKAALFAAVVHRIIERLRPPPEVPLLEGTTVAQKLQCLAGIMLRAALAPQSLALTRLITAESARFPELARAVINQGGTQEATGMIADLLARELTGTRLSADFRQFAAQQFIQMVVAVPQRRAIGYGNAMGPGEFDRWAENVVTLFLDGCRGAGTGERTPRRRSRGGRAAA